MPGIVQVQDRSNQVTTYTQLPGTMSLAFKRGDDFATSIDFGGVSLVGYRYDEHADVFVPPVAEAGAN